MKLASLFPSKVETCLYTMLLKTLDANDVYISAFPLYKNCINVIKYVECIKLNYILIDFYQRYIDKEKNKAW